ncbi:MAG: hypothetical protein MUP45_04070 [Candidatus Marinimicrobia bacterium]|nr:hypothetical protein [Candidatus Neomarinimicrobiota bacterium]
MTKKMISKKPAKTSQEEPPFRHKRLGYRTPDRFKRQVFRRNPALTTQRPRSLGGHQ